MIRTTTPLDLTSADTEAGRTPKARDKKAVVVFPPLTMPTSPPPGAALLKGFVERELPEW
jgi:hypothetical protein